MAHQYFEVKCEVVEGSKHNSTVVGGLGPKETLNDTSRGTL